MSKIRVLVSGRDVTKYVSQISTLSEYNNESNFHSGVFRRSSLSLTFNNMNNLFDSNSELFQGTRENKKVSLFYSPNSPDLNEMFIFEGVIHEGSTSDNVSAKNVSFVVVDLLKQIEKVTFEEGDHKKIDDVYGSKEIKLDKTYINNFLDFINTKGELNLTFEVGLTIESIYPPSDSYYNSKDVSCLNILNEFIKATNSWASVERGKVVINPRPQSTSFINIRESEILDISNETEGLNKVYNIIKINGLEVGKDEASIESYGTRNLDVTTYAAPSPELADTYLDYYKEPKRELDLTLKMNNRTLGLKIGFPITVDIKGKDDLSLKAFSINSYIIGRSFDFNNESVTLRLRES